MPDHFPIFDRNKLCLKPLKERQHDLDSSVISDLSPPLNIHPTFRKVASEIREAVERGSSVILMMGAHVIRSGVQRYVIDLMEKGYISCIATNGASVIHDFELALIGATTESVAHYIKTGEFGLWEETSRINNIVREAAMKEMGIGEAVGMAIEDEKFPHRDISLFATGYKLGIPMTVHVGIGYDIVHEHPNCDGASYGATSYTDFLRFAKVLESLEGGVVTSFGSAIMAPEVFLKALAMVRNVACRQGRQISRFTTLACDLLPLPEGEYRTEAAKDSPLYYFRPWKTMLVRAVEDSGKSYYFQGVHAQTIPQLWAAIMGDC
jgi:hypothetical protein